MLIRDRHSISFQNHPRKVFQGKHTIVHCPFQFQPCHCAACPVVQIIFVVKIQKFLLGVKAGQIQLQSVLIQRGFSYYLSGKQFIGAHFYHQTYFLVGRIKQHNERKWLRQEIKAILQLFGMNYVAQHLEKIMQDERLTSS